MDTVAFVAVAFAAVSDAYKESVYQGSAGYTDSFYRASFCIGLIRSLTIGLFPTSARKSRGSLSSFSKNKLRPIDRD